MTGSIVVKALKQIRGASIDIRESKYFTRSSARRLKRTAKRTSKRANRRIGKALARDADRG